MDLDINNTGDKVEDRAVSIAAHRCEGLKGADRNLGAIS
jgi:hypothetical protein